MPRPAKPSSRSPKRAPRRSSPPPPRAPQPPPTPAPHARPPRRRQSRRYTPKTLLILGAAVSLIVTGLCIGGTLAIFGLIVASGQVLPGVNSAGVDLGGMNEAEAVSALRQAWDGAGIVLRDGDRTWAVSPEELGLALDAQATAAAARRWGRSDGGIGGALRGILGRVEIDPVLSVDLAVLSSYLQTVQVVVDLPAINAGVSLVNGQVTSSPASDGRALDIAATVDRMRINAAGELADGALDLVMVPFVPVITDAAPLVAQAQALLSSPFNVDAYDPIRDEWLHWSAPPQVWAFWLTSQPAAGSSTGLTLAMNNAGPASFLETNARFADERYIKLDEAVAAMQAALARNQTGAVIRVWHQPTTYTVRPHQTLASIGEEVGIPYPYIQAANPGINTDALSVGQTLTLPSKDVLVPLEPVPNKRIIISRGQQRLWAYENGQVVFDWVISTGISTSPTAPGVFQVQSHELNAYAEQWNLFMPHFIGFYHPGPNVEVMNGFHGFPTRQGGYLLWTENLGRPATYGCVLLSLQNAETFYYWAEEGVVVEVRIG